MLQYFENYCYPNCSEDMMNANKLTTFQFKERITETKHAKNKLEEHLTKVIKSSFFQLSDIILR